eukprot:4477347-Alexandrium_andersonii.AAC.2
MGASAVAAHIALIPEAVKHRNTDINCRAYSQWRPHEWCRSVQGLPRTWSPLPEGHTSQAGKEVSSRGPYLINKALAKAASPTRAAIEPAPGASLGSASASSGGPAGSAPAPSPPAKGDPEAPMPKYLRDMKRQLDDLARRNQELESRFSAPEKKTDGVATRVATLAEDVGKHGRKAEAALAPALWCTDAQRESQNKQASREAIVSDWPRAASFADRKWYVDQHVKRIGWHEEFSHADPAGSAESARAVIAVFKSKYSRDAFLKSLKDQGLKIQGLYAQGRPQAPKYLRESQQLLRCCVKPYSETLGIDRQLKPEWDVQAVLDQGTWCLAVGDHDESPLYKDIAVDIRSESRRATFESNLNRLWATWGRGGSPPRRRAPFLQTAARGKARGAFLRAGLRKV